MDSNQPRIRVLIVDDHPLFREGLRMLLEAEQGFEVVGEAGDGHQAVEVTARLEPDIVLLDVSMPRLTGLDALAHIGRQCPRVRIVLLTATIERRQMVDALKLGARGVILKEAASLMLYRCLRDVMAGGLWVEHGVVEDLVQALREPDAGGPAPMAQLTVRERQIVSAIVEGATNEDIATQFGMRRQTVKNHLSSIFDKCGVSSRLELALFAMSHGIADGARGNAALPSPGDDRRACSPERAVLDDSRS